MEQKKWQYMRDGVANLDELDKKLAHWGDLGWELVSTLHTKMVKRTPGEHRLAPSEYADTEGFIIVLKRAA
jgi:hypothetical protein